MLCELLFHPAQAIQASHRHSYALELLKHGEMWGLLPAPLWVSCTPSSCSTTRWGLASIAAFLCRLHCLVGYVSQADLQSPAGLPSRSPLCCQHCWKGRGGHQPGHGACCPEIKTRNSLGIESRELLGNCNSFCDRGRLWALLEEQTWKVFLVAGAGSKHLPGYFLYSYQVQDQCFYQGPSKHTIQTAQVDTCAHQSLLAMPTHRTLGASQIQMGHWASWSPRDCWRSLETDTGSLEPGPQWQGTCPKLRLPTAARPASLHFTEGEKESWRNQSQYVNLEQRLSLPNSCSTLGG